MVTQDKYLSTVSILKNSTGVQTSPVEKEMLPLLAECIFLAADDSTRYKSR
jgi:hypothetical protein